MSKSHFLLCSIAVLLFLTGLSASAQVLSFNGKVIDKTGQPVIGAAVVNTSDRSVGTITDVDGTFTLAAAKGDILEISSLGYTTTKVTVGESGDITVILQEDSEFLSEAVVVGYGTIKKKDLTGAVASVSDKDLKDTPVANVGQALQGKVSGVYILDSGKPGDNVTMKIRGLGTINDSDPLVVIDGVPTDLGLTSLNTADIDRIDVLKDASATAIYGSRGANGVVMITTKKGTIGQPKIKYDGSFGIQHITKTIPMMDAYEFVKLQAERSPKDMETTYFMNYDGKKWGLEDYRNIPQYNWQDEIFRSAWMQSHNVSLTGGSEGVRYNASLSYYDQDGILLESNYKRVQGRMGTTIQKKKLKIYLTTNYSSTTTTGGSPSQNSYSGMNNLFYSVWGYRPVTEPDRPLNSLMDNIMDDAINNTNDYRFNPIMSLKNEYRKTYANYIQFNGFAEYEFIKGLKLKVSGGYTFDTRKGETFNNSKTRYGNPKSSDKVNAEIYHSQRATWLNENILTYQTNIKRKHFFNSMVGVTLQNSDYEYYSYKTVDSERSTRHGGNE